MEEFMQFIAYQKACVKDYQEGGCNARSEFPEYFDAEKEEEKDGAGLDDFFMCDKIRDVVTWFKRYDISEQIKEICGCRRVFASGGFSVYLIDGDIQVSKGKKRRNTYDKKEGYIYVYTESL